MDKQSSTVDFLYSTTTDHEIKCSSKFLKQGIYTYVYRSSFTFVVNKKEADTLSDLYELFQCN